MDIGTMWGLDRRCAFRAGQSFDNNGTETAKVLCVVTPAAIGPEYFREAFAIFGAGGPPDRARIMDLMRRFGLTPAPPPPQA